ncbi:MAG: monofunctional biosynthetic peptidoglycan transglycosylase [Dysgonamonadaceae bacterium]|jgi:monofunctional biosynthetic peptidoglycan transglycosylase|nr:monofunctional biosynthetic peptidoglycan transglycosylase [Dysgonamonadaceae bacterium]
MKTIRWILVWSRNIVLCFVLLSFVLVIVYKFVPVYYTPLMFIRLREQNTGTIKHRWVPMDRISQSVVQAVVASEDNLYMEHPGFDRFQINKAISNTRRGKRPRGASTISQQTAKNVFLWPKRSYFRKALEAYFTILIEKVWGKERIMEVYLNSIEMGVGIYGIEAASQAYYGKQAYQLTRGEAALIAAILPDPQRRNPTRVSVYLQKRQEQILSLMQKLEPVPIGYRRLD